MEEKQHPQNRMIGWLISLLFLVIGGIFYVCVSGCGFLGIVFLVVAVICAIDSLLALWEKYKAVRVAKTVWSILVILVLVASVVTLIPVLRGPVNAQGGSDYVIVLGCGVRGTEPSECLQDRIDRAYIYLEENPEAICVATGGQGSDENISEAQCIFNYLTAMGIDGSRIWMENQATSTIENFRYSIALIQEKTGHVPASVTVLSSEYHLYRASIMAEDCDLNANFVAAPTSKPLIRVSYSIREVFALWKYLLVGG